MTREAHFLDFPRPGLAPEVWTGDPPVLTEKAEATIQQAISEFLISTGLSREDLFIVFVTGSIGGLSWTEDTDIDVHIIVKDKSGADRDSTRDITDALSEKHFIGTHPLQFYCETESSLKDKEWFGRVDNVYDVFKKKWLKNNRFTVDDPYEKFHVIIERANSWCKRLDLDIGETRRDLLEYQYLEDQMAKVSSEERVAIKKHLQELKTELDNDVAILLGDFEDLHDLRSRAFDRELENSDDEWMAIAWKYKSKNLLPENLIFKQVERYKYLQLLRAVQKASQKGELENYKNVPVQMLNLDTY